MVTRLTKDGRVMWFCPGCEAVHSIDPKRWVWNGSRDKPVFHPSVLVTWAGVIAGQTVTRVCHSFVTDGKMDFLSDCTHSLAGKTVDIPEWPYAPETFGGIVEVDHE